MKNVVLIYFLKVYRPGIYNLQLITTQIKNLACSTEHTRLLKCILQKN